MTAQSAAAVGQFGQIVAIGRNPGDRDGKGATAGLQARLLNWYIDTSGVPPQFSHVEPLSRLLDHRALEL